MIQAKPIHTDSYFVKAKKVAAFYDYNFFILKIRIENKKQLYTEKTSKLKKLKRNGEMGVSSKVKQEKYIKEKQV